MRLVISQPMFMPWRGLFEMIQLSDRVLVYDDVQLPLGGGRGRGFITRIQIKTPNGVQWLSLPVARAGAGKQLISEAAFSNPNFRHQHLARIEQAYRDAPHFVEVYESVVKPIYAFQTDSVSEFCLHSMQSIWKALEMNPAMSISSQIGLAREERASERVLAYCMHFGAGDYISGLGAMNYIDYELFENARVRICYMDYDLSPYPQMHGAFTPYMSGIDLLFNVGPEATLHLHPRARYWKEWPTFAGGRPARHPTARTDSTSGRT